VSRTVNLSGAKKVFDQIEVELLDGNDGRLEVKRLYGAGSPLRSARKAVRGVKARAIGAGL